MHCTECNLSLSSSEEFHEHMSKYHLMGIMINTSKGSNKMFTRTIEGYFSCPTCFGICKNVTEVLKHLFCEIKPPKLSDFEPLPKNVKNSLEVKPLNSLLSSTLNQFPIPCEPETESLHYHFIPPVESEFDFDIQNNDSNVISFRSKINIETSRLENPVRELFISIVLKYIKSRISANSMFDRIDAIPEGKFITWTALLKNLSYKTRPKLEEGRKMLMELVDTEIFITKQSSKNSICLQKGPIFFN